MTRKVSWIDGNTDIEVEARVSNPDSATDLAMNMSQGADATIEWNNGHTLFSIKYENGTVADEWQGPMVHDLAHGWTARFDAIGGLVLEGAADKFNLNVDQVKKLRALLV